MTNTQKNHAKPIVLIILDGWGYTTETNHNPLRNVNTPCFDHLFAQYPHTLLQASGEAVGLPKGQMGNSEVGHLHIGSGRKVPQDLTRIDKAIKDGEFYKNTALLSAIETAKNNDKAVHILGLLSPGGVHSHESQLAAMIEMVHQQGVKKNYLHALLDGRDTPPRSALPSIEMISSLYQKLGSGQIASVVGRYYAMDRDKRWERTEKAYNLLTAGIAEYHSATAADALKQAYAHDENDEFVKPCSIHAADQNAITIEDGDVVIFMNFRADRARQLCYALTENEFKGFKRNVFPKIASLTTLTQYASDLEANVAFPPLQLHNTLGEYLATHGLTQLRIAETEKYAHVTYFLNGGAETPFSGEDRLMIPSPKVATYDLQPEMSALELTDKLINAITSKEYDVIICNYANPDMVGHTGNELAANHAVTVIDQCMQRIVDCLDEVGGEALVTADHGNIECMYNPETQQPHTAHTSNLVPLLYVGHQGHFNSKEGALDDIAPTLLHLLGFTPPQEMTGHNLLSNKDD